MKKLTSFALILSAFACGDVDTTYLDNPETEVPFHETLDVPGQEGRIDGSVWNDGLFNSDAAKQEFCAEYGWLDEAWFCSDLGQTAQAFQAEVFHGMQLNADGTCYGPQQGNKDCLFPRKKQFRVKLDTSNCFNGQAPPNGPSTLQEQNILDGLKAGIKLWHGKGGLTVVNDGSPGSSSYTLIEIKCGETSVAGALAEGGLGGAITNRGDLPSVNGKNPKNAILADKAFFVVNIPRTFKHIKDRCGLNDNTLIFNTARFFGVHEMGHVLAFDHFNSTNAGNIMNPFVSACAPSSTITSVFTKAVENFDPAGGPVNVVSTSGLGSYTPS